MTQTRKNFLYNIIYQGLILILPFITVPYVSRILGTDGIGIYSFTYSIIYYFIIIAMLGINNYGSRTIAKTRNDKVVVSKNFFSIYSIQLVMSLLMIILYTIYVFIFDIEYKSIATIQILHLISCVFDINWFFFGFEKFKITVTRNFIIKLLSLIAVFLFVKSKNDLWIYTLILAGSTLISNLSLLPFLFKEICYVKIEWYDIKKHLKPVCILFLPYIALSLYKVMDKIMLGCMSNVNEVGLYEQAEKIINMPLSIVTALGVVMIPRISNLISKNNNKSVERYINKSINFIMFLAFPICFGLISISSNFVPIFLGNDFAKSAILIYYLSPTLIFISFANVIRTQYLIPMEKDKVFVLSLTCGAIINLIVNFCLIPKYNSVGACIGTIFAELFVMLYQIISIKNELPIKKYLLEILPFFAKAFIMGVIVILIGMLNENNIAILVIQIFTGIIIYALMNIKYIFKELLKNRL